jgi:hypothetical protein
MSRALAGALPLSALSLQPQWPAASRVETAAAADMSSAKQGPPGQLTALLGLAAQGAGHQRLGVLALAASAGASAEQLTLRELTAALAAAQGEQRGAQLWPLQRSSSGQRGQQRPVL